MKAYRYSKAEGNRVDAAHRGTTIINRCTHAHTSSVVVVFWVGRFLAHGISMHTETFSSFEWKFVSKCAQQHSPAIWLCFLAPRTGLDGKEMDTGH